MHGTPGERLQRSAEHQPDAEKNRKVGAATIGRNAYAPAPLDWSSNAGLSQFPNARRASWAPTVEFSVLAGR